MANGNACWKQEDLSDSLFEPQTPPSMFTIRANKDYEEAYQNYQYDRQFMKRVNGELCAFNTIEIIKGISLGIGLLKIQPQGDCGNI